MSPDQIMSDIKTHLQSLSRQDMHALADSIDGVSVHTLISIRYGRTADPGFCAVIKILDAITGGNNDE